MRLASLYVLLLTARVAAADEPAAAATMMDPDTEVARRRFERGSELYENAQYAAAIVEFKAANEARPLAALDFNIARCYDRLGDWTNALDYYRRYLAGSGNLPDADEVRARIAALEERTRKLAPPPAPAPAPVPVPAPPPPRSLRIPALVVGAAAIVAFAAGGGLYGSVAADFPSRKSYCAALPRECVPSEWADLQTRRDASYAMFAIGGALAAADVALWIVDLRRARKWHAHAWLVPTATGFAAGGRF